MLQGSSPSTQSMAQLPAPEQRRRKKLVHARRLLACSARRGTRSPTTGCRRRHTAQRLPPRRRWGDRRGAGRHGRWPHAAQTDEGARDVVGRPPQTAPAHRGSRAHLAAFSPNPMATNTTPIVTNVMIAQRGVRIGCHAVRLRGGGRVGKGWKKGVVGHTIKEDQQVSPLLVKGTVGRSLRRRHGLPGGKRFSCCTRSS